MGNIYKIDEKQMEQINTDIVNIRYQQTGASSATNALGMREMQAKAYEARNQRFLLIKAPPASGKSRALMFIALDKLANQGIKKVIVAVPEKSIGRSFKNTNLKEHGVEVKGKKVLVLGAGGAATAIQVQLALEGTEEIQIFNRQDEFYERALETRKKLEEKVPQCKVAVNRLEDKEKLQKAVAEADILANATIVGMKPDLHEETLIPKEWMRKDLVVADIVYNPEVTRMLKEAREAGCQTIEGKGMMLWQGAENYRLFTGKEMPVEAYKDAMRTAAAMPPSP